MRPSDPLEGGTWQGVSSSWICLVERNVTSGTVTTGDADIESGVVSFFKEMSVLVDNGSIGTGGVQV